MAQRRPAAAARQLIDRRDGKRTSRWWVRCGHVPVRKWPLLRARRLRRDVIESFKREPLPGVKFIRWPGPLAVRGQRGGLPRTPARRSPSARGSASPRLENGRAGQGRTGPRRRARSVASPHTLATTLSAAQDLIVVELRRALLLALDHLLAVIRAFINPALSRDRDSTGACAATRSLSSSACSLRSRARSSRSTPTRPPTTTLLRSAP